MTCNQHDFCMKSSATLLACLLTLCAAASASEIQCKVVAVADGDTVTCLADSAASIGSKTTCRQMTSCDEAKRYLAAGFTKLDRDGDGIPCEALCR